MLSLSSLAQNVTILPSGITPALSGTIPTYTNEEIEALPSPDFGTLVNDITFKCLRYYDGKHWSKLLTNHDPNSTSMTAWSANGQGQEAGEGIAIDNSGNIYICGTYSDMLTIGNITLTSKGVNDIFIAKYNKSGTLLWAKSAGGTSVDGAIDLGIDEEGNVYVTGYFTNNADFDNIKLTGIGNWDVFIAKYDTNGNAKWAQKGGGNNLDTPNGMFVDNNGNVYIAGHFSASATFTSTVITSAGDIDAFFAKYNNAGVLQWVKRIGGTSGDFGYNIEEDASGNVYMVGNFHGTVSFGNISITNAGGSDAFIAKYKSATDTWIWVKQAGGTETDIATDVAIGTNGDIIVSGVFQGSAKFSANDVVISTGMYDVFIARYNSDGTLLWVKRAGSKNNDTINSLAIDANDNIYVTGAFYDLVNFGNIFVASTGIRDIFIAKYNSMGYPEWAQSAGGKSDDVANRIAVQANGNAYITGTFNGNAKFGETFVTGGTSGVFVARVRD